MKNRLEQKTEVQLFAEAAEKSKEVRKRRKKKVNALKRAALLNV